MPSESPSRSVGRITAILNCFTAEEPVQNLTGISRRIGLAKSTTHRLVTALVDEGFLMRDAMGRGYQLGYQMVYLGTVAQAGLNLRNEALPVLRALAAALGETTILTVRDGMSSLVLEIIESSQPVRMAMQIGQRRQLYAGASSKVLLAFLPPEELEQALASMPLLPIAANTITDRSALRAEIELIQATGYATSFEETDAGAMGVSAPVYDHAGHVVAGIGITAPAARIPPQRVPEIAPPVVDAARQLSARLGAQMPDHKPRTAEITRLSL